MFRHSTPVITTNKKVMFPIADDILEIAISDEKITDIKTATIRQICALAARLENIANQPMLHLELGNPGLPPEDIGMEAEKAAIRPGVVNCYPNIGGMPELKNAGSRFVKSFLDLEISPRSIVPTVGSMQGSFTLQLLLKMRDTGKDTMLFLHPGFPAQWHQAKLLGIKCKSIDIYSCRGDKLRDAIEEVLAQGGITGIIYSNPNNPAWTNFSNHELEIIGELATKYDAIVIEDMAYMGMDFRRYSGEPAKEPFVPTVGKYTDNYIILISASKIFSYAGQRIAMVCMSDKTYERHFPVLESFFEMPNFGDCYVYGVLYTASSGATHSAQYALAAMLDAAVSGELDFVTNTSEYAIRCAAVKKLFLENGFKLVYESDVDDMISDGFFFTANYQDFKSEEVQRELLRYGISTISLPCTGSKENGVRICVSTVSKPEDFDLLSSRLKQFNDEHKICQS